MAKIDLRRVSYIPQNLVKYGQQTAEITSRFSSHPQKILYFRDCQRVHAEVNERKSTKLYKLKSDLKIYVDNWGSLPKNVGSRNCSRQHISANGKCYRRTDKK